MEKGAAEPPGLALLSPAPLARFNKPGVPASRRLPVEMKSKAPGADCELKAPGSRSAEKLHSSSVACTQTTHKDSTPGRIPVARPGEQRNRFELLMCRVQHEQLETKKGASLPLNQDSHSLLFAELSRSLVCRKLQLGHLVGNNQHEPGHPILHAKGPS